MAIDERSKETSANGPVNQDPQAITTATGCLIRMIWMLVGLAMLILSLVMVAVHGKTWGGAADIVFFAVLFLCIGARLADRAAVQPSKRKYATLMAVLGIASWGFAHLIGPLLFS